MSEAGSDTSNKKRKYEDISYTEVPSSDHFYSESIFQQEMRSYLKSVEDAKKEREKKDEKETQPTEPPPLKKQKTFHRHKCSPVQCMFCSRKESKNHVEVIVCGRDCSAAIACEDCCALIRLGEGHKKVSDYYSLKLKRRHNNNKH